jgi:predicted RNA-binding protein YlxR (DUF448 family)
MTHEHLPPGEVVAERFTVEKLAGRGGMGAVYRARDGQTGQPVALKLLHAVTSPEVAYRFKREAVLLAELRHPAIVSYVAHGMTRGHQPFLAMEWLEGENLEDRLARKPLSLSETLTLLNRITEGLATAHALDIVHRDIKPSNIFLREGRPEDAVLLDFGLARYAMPTLVAVTGSQMVVGTPGYMAPEQASSQPRITATADMFSLGCVLYECLTGQPPFAAPHFTAALAKILFAEPAPLHTLRPGLPPGLQVLMDRMLDKLPERRMPDAASLLASLSALESVPELLSVRREAGGEPPAHLRRIQQQLVSIVLVSRGAPPPEDAGHDTVRRYVPRDSIVLELAPYGAQLEPLADGSLVATIIPEHGAATDQAALAARCALALKEQWPEAAVVLATGRGFLNERLPVGEAMDKAGWLLCQLERMPAPTPVVMDEVTAGLLGPGFQLSRAQAGTFLLQGERHNTDMSRPLLGKPTPCVGREQELARLELAFSICVEEPTPQVVLVTAPAGMGKSRVRHEFLRRIEQRSQPVRVLLGRGDPMRTGSAYGLLGQALLGLCGLQGSEELAVRRERLARRTALHLPAAKAREVAEFLGELCGIPFPDEESPRLRAARGDPQLMSPQLGHALVTFLRAECQQGAVLLVLEDLHWSDAPTVRLVDEALQELAEQPLMVLALARPEVKEAFPRLWAGWLQEQPLRGLSRKASARLVHEVLGPHVPDPVVDRIFEQSSGNALFLEELIRMVAEGRGGAPPETVLAMLQARLLRLEAGPRQVLLAASLFGRAFWLNGLEALLGQQVSRRELERWLRQLVELELIEQQHSPRFPSQVEYRFRHALVRDVAHGLVPEEDKPVGHQRVGSWLEQQNEPDPLVLAEHYQLGQQPERAAPFFCRSAEQFFERSDMEGALRCVEAALLCGLTGEANLRMRALQAFIAFTMNDFARTVELGGEVLPELNPGSLPWSRVMAALLVANSFLGEPEQMFRLAGQLLCATPDPDAITAYVQALSFACNLFLMRGPRHAPQALASRMAKVGAPHMDSNALLRGWVLFAHGCLAYQGGDTPWQTCDVAGRCVQSFREVNLDVTGLLPGMLVLAGQAWAALGDMPRAVKQLEEALAIARQSRQQVTIAYVQAHQCLVLSGSADPGVQERLHTYARELVAAREENLLTKGAGYYLLARLAADRHALAEAEAHAREACARLESLPYYLLQARVFLSSLLLAQGRVAEAREEALRGIQSLEKMGGGMHTLSVQLALAEACLAAGASAEADAALRTALHSLRIRARDIPEPAARERFLREVPENARLIERVQQRWGKPWETLEE